MPLFVDDLIISIGNLKQSIIYKIDIFQFLYLQNLDYNVILCYVILF